MNESERKLVAGLHARFFRVVSLDPDDFLPETLYHYTSAAGLHGIVTSGKLWGTNYSYLNDSSELQYGLSEVALPVIERRLETEGDTNRRSFLMSIRKSLDATAGGIDFYLTCFCQAPDLLSQWRGYGAASGRFCIGFNAESLLCETKAIKMNSGVVIYEQGKQRRKVETALDTTLETLTQGRANHDAFLAATADELVRKLLQELCFFKHPGFKEENEWRMAHFAHDGSSVQVRPSGGLLKPFIDMVETSSDSTTLPITEIIVGHSRMGPLAKKSVGLLLKSHGYNDVEVRESKVPFREF